MNADQKKRIAHEISNWKNACNCRAVQLAGDRMAALLQELTDAPEPVPVAWLPGGFRIEHFAKDDPMLTDEANAERRFFVKRIEPPYHKDGVWFGATAGEALAKARAALGIEYAAPPAPSAPDGWIRAIDEALVVHHIDIADSSDGYEEAKKKLNELLAITSDIARDCSEPPADLVRDAERLDWLLRNLPGVALRYCVGVLSDTSDGKEFRDAIDAAIERQGGE